MTTARRVAKASFNEYYEDELEFLREMGKEFARAHPSAAPMLAEAKADPDVERLLEGFAFLAGRLRQKLDDELPELTQSLMQMLWPHYLRPVPAMSILQFDPLAKVVQAPMQVDRGTEVQSVPVDGTPCRFRTCYDVRLQPLALETAEVSLPEGSKGQLRLRLRWMPGSDPAQIENRLRFHLHGDSSTPFALHLFLTHRLGRVVVRPLDGESAGRELVLRPDCVQTVGFADDEALLPYSAHALSGYRLLQEYFTLPQKFLFLDVCGLAALSQFGTYETFEIVFELSDTPPASLLRVDRDNIRLYCTPVANLFEMESDPIRVDDRRVEYLVRPGGRNSGHFEIFSVDSMRGWVKGSNQEYEYPSFFSFRSIVSPEAGASETYYVLRLKDAVVGLDVDTDDGVGGVDSYASFVSSSQEKAIPPTERIVAKLTCSNRHLPSRLRVGDLKMPTGSSPEFATFHDIRPATPSLPPPLGGDLLWRVIACLSTNYLSFSSQRSAAGQASADGPRVSRDEQALEVLRNLLATHSFHVRAAGKRESEMRLQGIRRAHTSPEEMIYRGSSIRGSRVQLDMKESQFVDEGEMVLFANVLNEFFSLSCSLNSFSHLVVRGVDFGEEYQWSPTTGRQPLI